MSNSNQPESLHGQATSDIHQSFPLDWTLDECSQWQHIAEQVKNWKQSGLRVGLVTGVFDLLHVEHQRFIDRALQQGDRLVVGLESDARVRNMKGPGRPQQSQETRLAQVLGLSVSRAAVLPEQFGQPEHHSAFIHLLQPDYLAVSSHSPHQDKKRAILSDIGAELLVVHDHNPEISTTKLLHQQQAE